MEIGNTPVVLHGTLNGEATTVPARKGRYPSGREEPSVTVLEQLGMSGAKRFFRAVQSRLGLSTFKWRQPVPVSLEAEKNCEIPTAPGRKISQ